MSDAAAPHDPYEGKPPEVKAALMRAHARWEHAARLASMRPDLDAGDIYHALRCLELAPTERLVRGLNRVTAPARTR